MLAKVLLIEMVTAGNTIRLPLKSRLTSSNNTPIRYLKLFTWPGVRFSHAVVCPRRPTTIGYISPLSLTAQPIPENEVI